MDREERLEFWSRFAAAALPNAIETMPPSLQDHHDAQRTVVKRAAHYADLMMAELSYRITPSKGDS